MTDLEQASANVGPTGSSGSIDSKARSRFKPGPAAAVAVLVGLLAWLSLALTHQFGRVSPIWLPNSLWLVFLMKSPQRQWASLLAAGTAGNVLADIALGDSLALAAGLSAANVVEVAACAGAIAILLKGRVRVGQLADLAVFGLIALFGAALAATVGAGHLLWLKGGGFWRAWSVWCASDGLGLFILTPPLIALAGGELKRLLAPQMVRRTLTVGGLLLTAIGAAMVFPEHPLLMITPPLLTLAALQLEIGGAAVGMLMVAAAAAAFTALGWIPSALAKRPPVEQIFGLQLFLLMMGVMTFPIAAVLAGRRELEAKLLRSRDEFEEANRLARMAERLAGIGYWRIERGAPFVWSEQMYRIYGLDPAAGAPALEAATDYVHPADRQKLLDHHRRHSAGEAPDLNVRIVRPDGEIRHVLVRSMVERDAAGEVTARFGTVSDITDHKLAEAAALASEQRYRFLAENVPDMIVRTSLHGDMVYCSPSSVRVFGYTPEQMMLQNAQDMTHPEDFGRVMQSIFRLIEERLYRLPEPIHYRAKNSSGEWVWIETNPTLIFDERGEPLEFIDIVRNITQTKLFEAELEDARERAEAAAAAKSAFLANMSHELRTPLTSIIGFSRLMADRADLPSEARHYTGRIRDASEALLAIINDVLDFSKLEVGQVRLEYQPLSVQRLVDETTGLLTIQAAAKGVEIRSRVDAFVPEQVLGDVARLRQVLLNFLSNAVKFTSRGSVTVEAAYRDTAEGPRLRVAVADTGDGIAPENLERLFERFSQAEVSINRTHGGTGLGLAISKGIVELMGGEIGVNTVLGEGSTFWFEIPADAAEAAAPIAADGGSDLACPPLRLLVVDDTAVNRELVKLMLEPLGFSIREAGGGSDGIQAAMTEPFDLILMDVRMPGIDGLDATRVIRTSGGLNAATPILALTADVQPENAAACQAAGMNDVVAKPIAPAELLTKIVHWGTGQASPGVETKSATATN